MYYIIALVALVISLIAQGMISLNYRKYKKIKVACNKSGVEIAQEILKAHDLENIYVVETKGYLSDHYDPKAKVIRLSSEIFNDETIASVAVAAHEVGHAIQHKEGNVLIKIRNALVPLINFASQLGYIVIFIGLIAGITQLFYIGIVMISLILLFQLLTLPVEFDASKRARENLVKMNLVSDSESASVKKMLNAAAMTYVAAVLVSILEIVRLILMARDN